MTTYDLFTVGGFVNLLRLWREYDVDALKIICGPFQVFGDFDLARSTITIRTYESGRVEAGTPRWLDTKFVAFRCMYGLIRTHGLLCWDWENAGYYHDLDTILYEETVSVYAPHIRVIYPRQIEGLFLMQNMWSRSYMKIIPIVRELRTVVPASMNNRNMVMSPTSYIAPPGLAQMDNVEESELDEDPLPYLSELGLDLGFIG